MEALLNHQEYRPGEDRRQRKRTCPTLGHQPLRGSLIAYKLLMNLYICQLNGEQPTVKSLFASIPYSDMGIRYHLRKLLDDGWMELKPAPADKRTKVYVPTAKFEQACPRNP